MSPLFTFGARGKKAGASLAAVLARLLDDDGVEAAPEKGGKRKTSRQGAAPELAAMTCSGWDQAAPVAMGDLVILRSALCDSSFSILGLAPAQGDLELFSGAAAAVADLAGEGAGCFLTAETAGPTAVGLLRGRVGGSRFFSSRGGSVLVQIDEKAALAVESALVADPERFESLIPGEPASLPAPASLPIDRSQDFVLSYFFLPPLFPARAAEAGAPPPQAAAFWNSITPGAAPGASSVLVLAGAGDPKTGAFLLFECPSPPGADLQAYAASVLPLLKEGWNRALPRLAKILPEGAVPRFALVPSVPEAFLQGAVRIQGEVRLGSGGFPVIVHVPPRFVAALCSGLKPRPATPGKESDAMAALLSANEALLGRWSPGHREAFLKPRPAAGKKASAPPLAPLLAALGPRDAAVALQNCLIPRYGAQDLVYRFFYHAPYVKNGKRAMRPLPFAPFRDADVTALLPALAREEWEQERKHDLPRRTVPIADCAAANEEAARTVWEAARSGRIELSPGSYGLLEDKVGKPLAEAARRELDALARDDVPFGYLAALDKREASRIVDRLSNRDLALACVGDRRRVAILYTSMASGRRRDFDEELAIAESRIERGETGPEAAAAMKLSLLEQMKAFVEEFKRERAAESALDASPARRAVRGEGRRDGAAREAPPEDKPDKPPKRKR